MEDQSFIKWIVWVFGTVLIVGVLILILTGILGSWANQVNNYLFNTSQQHTGAVAQKFSDDCLQLAQASDNITRKAIENDIYTVASTVDLNNIQMPRMTRQCVDSAIQDITGK